MSSAVRTYNPARVLVLVGGTPMEGLGEDTFISIEPSADLITAKVGADGEVARSIGTNRMHTVTLTLQQTSPSNDILSGLAATDLLTCGGAAFNLTVEDLCGRTMFFAATAWVSKQPNTTFGRETGEREWQMATGTPGIFTVGGNQ